MRRLRTLLTLLPALALLWAGTGLLPHHAYAMDMWCWGDPQVSINGIPVSISVGVDAPAVQASKVIQQATIFITVPAGVSTAVLSIQSAAFKESVVFIHSKQHVKRGQPLPVTVGVLIQGNNPDRIETATRLVYEGQTKTDSSSVINTQYSYTLDQIEL